MSTQLENERITVAEAAKRMGMKPDALREDIMAQTTPFPAWAKRNSGKWVYVMPREGFERWMRGELPPTAKQIASELAQQLAPHLPDLFFHCFEREGNP